MKFERTNFKRLLDSSTFFNPFDFLRLRRWVERRHPAASAAQQRHLQTGPRPCV